MFASRTRAFATAALLATTTLSAPAFAQSAFTDPDSRRTYIGPGNVDVKTGSFAYEATDLSVGVGDFPSRLELKRWRRTSMPFGIPNSMGGFDHNFYVELGCENSGSNYAGPCPYGDVLVVRIGAVAHRFVNNGGTYVSDYGDGEQLTEESSRFVYKGRNGDQIIFPKSSDFYNVAGTTHLASVWEKANGDSIVFTWEIALKASGGWNAERRLAQVVNSRGYGFKFNYMAAGNATPESLTGNSFTDWQRKTVKSVQAIAPGCVSGTNATCDTTRLGTVVYNYSQWPTANNLGAYHMDSKTDPDNRVTTFTWTSARQLESESNPAMAGTSRFKNIYVNNAVTQQLDGKNKAWLYRRTLDANNNVIAAETEDPLHRITKYGFSVGFAAPDWIDDPDGRRTKFTYDTKLRIASVEMPSGKKATYVRDGRGNITSVTTTPSAAVASDQAQLLYSASFPTSCDSSNWRICNLPTSVTNPNQQTTDFTYDLNHGGLLTSLGPGSTPASRSFTKIAYATFVRAPTVETSSTTAPLRDVSLPVSAENCLSSNGTAGYVCPVSDSIKKTVTYTPSTATSRSQFLPYAVTDDPAGFNLTSSRTFDIVGNIVKTDGPRNDADIATMSFDKARHLTRQVSPDPDDSGPLAAPEINIDYDQSGRVLALRRRLNSADVTSSATYDADGGVSSFTSPESGTVNFVYDDAGEMIEVNQLVDGVTRRTKQSFDAVGRVSDVKAVSDSGTDVLKATYSYDPDGNVVTIGDGNGNKTNYCYDGFGRLKEVRFPSTSTPGSSTACSVTPAGGLPSTADFESYVLDAAGNPTSIRLRDGRTIAQSYDGAGRLQTTDVPEAGKDVTRAYDLLGRLTSATMAGDSSLSVGLAYDKLGRIVSSTSLGKTVSRSYAADGTSVQLVYPDSKALLYNVDRLGRVSEIWGIDEPTYGGTRSPQLAAFTYDQLSRRTRVDRGNTSSTIATYDSSQRLQDLFFDFSGTANDLHRTFTYNQAGEIKTTAVDNDGFAALVDAGTHNYAANGLNQYQSVDGVSVPYDGLGNLTGLAGKTFAYDSADALTNVSDGSGSTDLAYDALGRLAKISRGGSTTQFVYGTGGLLAEYDGAGTLLKRYVPGPDSDEPLVAYDGGTNKTWLYGDERGSIVAAADGSGNVISKVLYGPYGEGGQAALGRFGFTGQVYLPEIGLYDFKSRFYNPAIGRFMQTDAAGYAGGLNLYAYADGDPANLTDPMGTDPAPILWPLPPVTATIPPSNSSGSGGSMPPPSSIFTGWSDYGGWGALASMADNALRWQAWQRAHRGPAEEYAAQCTDGVSGSWMESARTVLGWTQVGADAVTLGAAATGIGGPVAITAKIVGLGAEGALGAINLYDCYANSACGHLADQAVGLSTRLIPGGSLRQMNKLLNGPARDVKGRFARSLWTSKKEAIDEAQKQGQRFFAEKASESIRCEK